MLHILHPASHPITCSLHSASRTRWRTQSLLVRWRKIRVLVSRTVYSVQSTVESFRLSIWPCLPRHFWRIAKRLREEGFPMTCQPSLPVGCKNLSPGFNSFQSMDPYGFKQVTEHILLAEIWKSVTDSANYPILSKRWNLLSPRPHVFCSVPPHKSSYIHT